MAQRYMVLKTLANKKGWCKLRPTYTKAHQLNMFYIPLKNYI